MSRLLMAAVLLLSAALPGIVLYLIGAYRWGSWLWFREKK